MRIVHVEQRSEEWLKLRRSKIGASDCAPIMQKSKYRSPRSVWRQKILGESVPINEAMQRGIDLEPEALEYFSKKLGLSFIPIVCLSDEYCWMLASLDGWNERNKVILEIKCVGKKTFDEVMSGKIPSDYQWQVQHQFCVTKAEMAFLGFYHKVGDEVRSVEILLVPDPDMIEELVREEGIFFREHMQCYVEPKLSDLDVFERHDADWYGISAKWKEVKKKINALEEEELRLRERLLELAGSVSCKGYGVSATRYETQGRIDYARIPELKGIDLDAYRGEKEIRWRLSMQD